MAYGRNDCSLCSDVGQHLRILQAAQKVSLSTGLALSSTTLTKLCLRRSSIIEFWPPKRLRCIETPHSQLAGCTTLVSISPWRVSVRALARHLLIIAGPKRAKCRAARRSPFFPAFSLRGLLIPLTLQSSILAVTLSCLPVAQGDEVILPCIVAIPATHNCKNGTSSLYIFVREIRHAALQGAAWRVSTICGIAGMWSDLVF